MTHHLRRLAIALAIAAALAIPASAANAGVNRPHPPSGREGCACVVHDPAPGTGVHHYPAPRPPKKHHHKAPVCKPGHHHKKPPATVWHAKPLPPVVHHATTKPAEPRIRTVADVKPLPKQLAMTGPGVPVGLVLAVALIFLVCGGAAIFLGRDRTHARRNSGRL